jgi:rhodanese-related sulfurtransferase
LSILDHFRAVPTVSTDEFSSFLEQHNPEDYNLVDVRQPGEYEGEHLPGAKLIPVGELEERLEELDPGKPTVAY